ncbi:MAG: ASKHA domain-containing protein [Desulfobacterales bacterium]|nr:ASKHA domain-containing protein [Desulfobacterales bacterium]
MKSPNWIFTVSLEQPSLQNNSADADRLVAALKTTTGADSIKIDLSLLKQLPDLIRKYNFHVRCIMFKDKNRWILTGIGPAEENWNVVGLAVDLGTTTMVLRLVDLVTGKTILEDSFDNPQISVGPDILTRIHAAEKGNGLDHLNKLVINGLNRMIRRVCREAGVAPEDIYIASLAGNTAMTHFFLGLDPRWIIREPYIPVINRPGVIKTSDLDIQLNSSTRMIVFPNIGSYFGGDLIAGILFSGINRAEETAILVDVGTNAEVVLGNKNWLMACAGAAGPALEGGVTRMGMMAAPGVIDQVIIDPLTGDVNCHTIGELQPRGICGSGLIDLAAQLFLSGMINIQGKFIPEKCGDRLIKINDICHFILVPAESSATERALTINQADIDSLVRSKAAMYTILETITNSVGTKFNDLSRFYVAGTFGSYINPVSAISIGMLPDLPLETYQSIGNSSLGGAAMVLTDRGVIDEIDNIRDRITYMELNVNQEFMNRFSAAKFLPHTDTSGFSSVSIPEQ